MKNTIKRLLLTVAVILGLAAPSFAQNQLVRTTLSSAIPAGTGTTQIFITSATNWVASNTGATSSVQTGQTYALVDRELLCVMAISSTTITVRRGCATTVATPHANGATIIWGIGGSWNGGTGNSSGVFIADNVVPHGTAARTSQQYLPLINVGRQRMYNLVGGNWTEQLMPSDSTALTGGPVCTIPGMGAAGIAGTGISLLPGTAGNFYITNFFNPTTRWITSLLPLWGSVVGSATGFQGGIIDANTSATPNILFNTTTAGTASGTAATMQGIALGTAGFLTGPATYYFFMQGAGTTDGIRVISLNVGNYGALSAGTFGTLSAITSASLPVTTTAGATSPLVCAN